MTALKNIGILSIDRSEDLSLYNTGDSMRNAIFLKISKSTRRSVTFFQYFQSHRENEVKSPLNACSLIMQNDTYLPAYVPRYLVVGCWCTSFEFPMTICAADVLKLHSKFFLCNIKLNMFFSITVLLWSTAILAIIFIYQKWTSYRLIRAAAL